MRMHCSSLEVDLTARNMIMMVNLAKDVTMALKDFHDSTSGHVETGNIKNPRKNLNSASAHSHGSALSSFNPRISELAPLCSLSVEAYVRSVKLCVYAESVKTGDRERYSHTKLVHRILVCFGKSRESRESVWRAYQTSKHLAIQRLCALRLSPQVSEDFINMFSSDLRSMQKEHLHKFKFSEFNGLFISVVEKSVQSIIAAIPEERKSPTAAECGVRSSVRPENISATDDGKESSSIDDPWSSAVVELEVKGICFSNRNMTYDSSCVLSLRELVISDRDKYSILQLSVKQQSQLKAAQNNPMTKSSGGNFRKGNSPKANLPSSPYKQSSGSENQSRTRILKATDYDLTQITADGSLPNTNPHIVDYPQVHQSVSNRSFVNESLSAKGSGPLAVNRGPLDRHYSSSGEVSQNYAISFAFQCTDAGSEFGQGGLHFLLLLQGPHGTYGTSNHLSRLLENPEKRAEFNRSHRCENFSINAAHTFAMLSPTAITSIIEEIMPVFSSVNEHYKYLNAIHVAQSINESSILEPSNGEAKMNGKIYSNVFSADSLGETKAPDIGKASPMPHVHMNDRNDNGNVGLTAFDDQHAKNCYDNDSSKAVTTVSSTMVTVSSALIVLSYDERLLARILSSDIR